MEKLRKYLAALPSGEIADTAELEALLAEAWDQFSSGYGSMPAHKIPGRLEDVKWNPPLLSFTIERHGAMKMGSSRAELQAWVVNLDQETADCSQTRYRQMYKREPPLKTKVLAEETGKLIVKREDSPNLKWYDEKTRVRVFIGNIILANVARQTLVGRRKRFRRDLTEFLKDYGWKETSWNNYSFVG